ncbi:cuticle protein AMP4-like [Penaeus japonicus]|uniref:cuticle protein AMP4-like n=1 Tax=Penaeus japonicus TaxID=27405 RepID=UPI001C70E9A9|nr:cuticle protein AMP4-like [Penaeus japonicus]
MHRTVTYHTTSAMKVFVLAAVLVLAAAAPQEPRPIQILLDERVQPEGGAYSFKYETENGIVQSEEGVPGLEGPTNVHPQKSTPLHISRTFGIRMIFHMLLVHLENPNGSIAEVRYQADENGFQAQSPLLPVAPEFPHPIPQFVLDQIAFAEEQDRLEQQQQLLQ